MAEPEGPAPSAPDSKGPVGGDRRVAKPGKAASANSIEARIDFFRKIKAEDEEAIRNLVRVEYDEKGKKEDVKQTIESIYAGIRYSVTCVRVKDDIYVYRDGVYVLDPGMMGIKYRLHCLARMIGYDSHLDPGTVRSLLERLRNEYDPDSHTYEIFQGHYLPLSNAIIDMSPGAEIKYCLMGPPEGIRKSKLLEARYDPEVMVAMRYAVEYDPAAKCPRFEAFLDSICSDDTMRTRILDMMAACLLPDKRNMNHFYILYGAGANGKSTLLDIIRAMVGIENCGSAPMQKFDERSNRFWGIHVFGKPCNLSDETGAERMESAANLRAITDRGIISVEEKYKTPKDVRPACTLAFCANELPVNPDRTDGFFRRVDLIEFASQFSGASADDTVKTIHLDSEELSGILNMLLPRMKRIVETGNVEHRPTLEDMREKYTYLMSPIEQYMKVRMEECEVLTHDDKSGSYMKAVYDDHNRWCIKNKFRTPSLRSFNAMLREMGYSTSRDFGGDVGGTKSGKQYWTGLRLRDQSEPPAGTES